VYKQIKDILNTYTANSRPNYLFSIYNQLLK